MSCSRYVTHPDFDPNNIRSVSSACEGLCRWVRAMEVYERVAKVSVPKTETETADVDLNIYHKLFIAELWRRRERSPTPYYSPVGQGYSKHKKFLDLKLKVHKGHNK